MAREMIPGESDCIHHVQRYLQEISEKLKVGGGGGARLGLDGATARPLLLLALGLLSAAAWVSRLSLAMETAVDFKCTWRQGQRS